MLCEGWQPKTTSAVDSGTKQKTEDFEVRKNVDFEKCQSAKVVVYNTLDS